MLLTYQPYQHQTTRIIYSFYAELPFIITIKRGVMKRFGKNLNLKINNEQKNVVKINDLTRAENHIAKNLQEFLSNLDSSFEKLEISPNKVELYELTPFNALLFKMHLTPTKVINTVEKLNHLTSMITDITK